MILQEQTIKLESFTFIELLWNNSESSFPDFLKEISQELKENNEAALTNITALIKKQMDLYPCKKSERIPWSKDTLTLLSEILTTEEILGFHHYIPSEQINQIQDELKEFLRLARKFAPKLNLTELSQALRNYIVFVMFRALNQQHPAFHNACFAYSLLYPFTDNYTDNEDHSKEDKLNYNQLIYDKLKDKEIHPKLYHHKKTCELLQMIENEYGRTSDSTIFSLLLMILDAQEKSMQLQNRNTIVTEQERLTCSIYKGGISVLIDRYFIAKEISGQDLLFYLGFGLFLQLVDDLQDIEEDLKHGNKTIFIVDLNPIHQESIVNKLFSFINSLTKQYQADHEELKEFILHRCYQLIITSVYQSMEFFLEEYLNKLEVFHPVTFHFMKQLQENINPDLNLNTKKGSKQYFNLLDQLLLNDNEENMIILSNKFSSTS